MRILILLITLLSYHTLMAQNSMFDVCPLKVGTEIPSSLLYDDTGKEHALKDLIAERPTVLVFYRGAWCGYCTKHLSELDEAKGQIEEQGYQILGITIDQASKLEESRTKSNSEIVVYSDAKAEAIKAFGLDWQVEEETFHKYKNEYKVDLEEWSGQTHHALPVPAVFIIKDGIVQFQYVNPNYNTRLKAETLLAILKTL